MKIILLWDPRFSDRRPRRLTVVDQVAFALVRAGVAAAADPGEAGALALGALALDPIAATPLVEIALMHGIGSTISRVTMPAGAAAIAVGAGVGAASGAAIAGIVVTPTPTPTPTPTIGARPVMLAAAYQLPDGLVPADPGSGYPCTDGDKDPDGTFWASHGYSSGSATAGVLHLSADFSTILDQYTVTALGLPSGSGQGIAVDTVAGTIWWMLKATSAGARLITLTKAGAIVTNTLLASANSNGVAYDSLRDQIVIFDGGTNVATWYNKSPFAATSRTITVSGTENDQIAHDPSRDELLVTGGPNGPAGRVKRYQVATGELLETITMPGADAIEGVVLRGNDYIVWNDAKTHPGSPALNRVLFYSGVMGPGGASPFASGPRPQRLNLVNRNAVAGTQYSSTIQGLTVGSPISAVASDGTAMTISGTSVTGTFATGGAPNVTLTEVVGGVSRDTVVAITVAASGSLEPESNALFARMATQPSATRKTAINSFVASLKSAGIWSTLDSLHLYTAHTQQAALLDWTGAHDATLIGAPVYAVDAGLTTDGSSSAIDLGFNPTQAAKFTQNSATMAVHALTDDGVGSASMGISGSSDCRIVRKSAGGSASGTCNTGAAQVAYAGSTAGLFSVSRESVNSTRLYKDGAQIAAATTASAARTIGNFRVGNGNSTWSSGRYACSAVAGSWTAAQHNQFNTALNAYLAALPNG